MPNESESSDVIPKLLSIPFKMKPKELRHQIIFRGRPAPILTASPLNSDKQGEGQFKHVWYEVHRWLCGSFELNRLFCWPCILMRPEASSWSSTGVDDFKRLANLACKHVSSKSHLKAIAEYDAVLVEIGMLPEFANHQDCKTEILSDSGSDHMGTNMEPQRPSTGSGATSRNASKQPATLTFRSWQQATQSMLEVKDARLARRKRRLVKIKIRNAQLEAQKIRLEIRLLEAKLEFQRTINQPSIEQMDDVAAAAHPNEKSVDLSSSRQIVSPVVLQNSGIIPLPNPVSDAVEIGR